MSQIVKITKNATNSLMLWRKNEEGTDYLEWFNDGDLIAIFYTFKEVEIFRQTISISTETCTGRLTGREYTGRYVARLQISPTDTKHAGLKGGTIQLLYFFSTGKIQTVGSAKIDVGL